MLLSPARTREMECCAASQELLPGYISSSWRPLVLSVRMPSDGSRESSSSTKMRTSWWCRARVRSAATAATALSSREPTFQTYTSFPTRFRRRFFGQYLPLPGHQKRPFQRTAFHFVKTTTQRAGKTSSISTSTSFPDFSEMISTPLHMKTWMNAYAFSRPRHYDVPGYLEVLPNRWVHVTDSFRGSLGLS